jgi:undecaprenyl pyrophosphate synthase
MTHITEKITWLLPKGAKLWMVYHMATDNWKRPYQNYLGAQFAAW